jgi:hypothetical protein
MPRPLSANSRKVLGQLGKDRSLDELSALTGIRKDRVAKILWHLRSLGWIAAGEEVRRLSVYKRVRELPPARRKTAAPLSQPAHIAALNAAFGISLPARRARGRTVRRSDDT